MGKYSIPQHLPLKLALMLAHGMYEVNILLVSVPQYPYLQTGLVMPTTSSLCCVDHGIDSSVRSRLNDSFSGSNLDDFTASSNHSVFHPSKSVHIAPCISDSSRDHSKHIH